MCLPTAQIIHLLLIYCYSYIYMLFFTFNLVNGFFLEGLRSEVSVAAQVSVEPPQEAAAV